MTLNDDTKYPHAEPDIPFAEALPAPSPDALVVQGTTSAPNGTRTVPTGAPIGSNGGHYHVANLGRQPKSITCPSCQQSIQTEVSHQIDVYTIVFCILLFFLFWPIFWLPLVLSPCKAAVHVCPKCRKQLGKTPTCCG